MAYARIDDGILERLMLLGVEETAADLYIRGIIWCNRNLTDGVIPKGAIAQFTQSKGKILTKKVAHLVEMRRWIDVGSSWEVHDFLDWNDSRKVVLERRKRHSEVVKRGRDQRRDLSRDQSRDQSVTANVTAPSPLLSSPLPDPEEPSAAAPLLPEVPPKPSDPADAVTEDAKDLAVWWNRDAPKGRVRMPLKGARLRHARARVAERPFDTHADEWTEIIAKAIEVQALPTCGWMDFDFLIREGNPDKILDGKYDHLLTKKGA